MGKYPMKTVIWISYDLGVRGDYEGIYAFLDAHGAKECGDSIAFLSFEYEDDLIAELKAKIEEYVDLQPRSRIYVLSRDNGRYKGRFVFGHRKRAPWAGYAGRDSEEEDDIE